MKNLRKFIDYNRNTVYIDISDIVAIQERSDYVLVYLSGGKVIELSTPVIEILEVINDTLNAGLVYG